MFAACSHLSVGDVQQAAQKLVKGDELVLALAMVVVVKVGG